MKNFAEEATRYQLKNAKMFFILAVCLVKRLKVCCLGSEEGNWIQYKDGFSFGLNRNATQSEFLFGKAIYAA